MIFLLSNSETALKKAVKLLAYRDYSVLELQHKLVAYGFDNDTIITTVECLCRRGYLDDSVLCRNLLEKHQREGKYGIQRIINILRQRYIPEAIIQQTVGSCDLSQEYDKALKLLVKHFNNTFDYARAGRFLLARGFTETVIVKALQTTKQ